MKKYLSFVFLIWILFSINSCDWQVPSEIQIKGSPSLKLAVGMDFSETFKSMMNSAFNSDENDLITVQNCVNAPGDVMTFLIRIKIAEIEKFSLSKLIPIEGITNDMLKILIGEGKKLSDFGVNNDIEIDFDESDEPIALPLDFLKYLDGFKFDPDLIKSKMYISGSDIAESLKIELDFNVKENNTIIKNELKIVKVSDAQASNIDLSSGIYNGYSLPPGGSEDDEIFPAEFFNEEGNLEIVYKIFIDKDEIITADMIDDAKIDIEMLLWFPLKFDAQNGAVFKLIDFDIMGDFFSSLSESGMIEAIKLEIEMNVNPFRDGDLIIINEEDGEWEKKCPAMTGEIISLDFEEGDIKYINDNPFKPKFNIVFKDAGDSLLIPKELKIMTVSVDADINYSIKIGGES
ncbi:MAG: hypothetical protein FWC19_06730 [Treponema sp.]|nr:hypothetical protein [Treponema sp.]MCL2272480.1 hypothetical protein [Treponema sp.]